MRRLILAMAILSSAAMAGKPASAILSQAYYYENKGELSYEYNGRSLMTVMVEPGTKLEWRGTSDGCLVSSPLTQQNYVAAPGDEPVLAKVTVRMKGDAICMRPRRAIAGEAILGQTGRPLIYGVNGIYGIDEDFLLFWDNCNWKWTGKAIESDPDNPGLVKAEFQVMLTKHPWLFNFRPRYYGEHLGYENYKPWEFRPKTAPVAGWCSWLAFGKSITEKDVVETADFLKEKFAPYGLEYLQIDDGYQNQEYGITKTQTLCDSWLEPIPGFPKGITNVAWQIKERGFRPGVWMNTDIRTYDPKEGARECIFRDTDGKPMRVPWIRHVNDLTDESLKETLAPLWHEFTRSGYEYVKIDSIRHAYFDGLGTAVRKGYITMDEARRRFRNLFATARKEAPDSFILSCWSIYSEAIGFIDGCRVSTDTNPSWQRHFLQQYEMARFWPMQRILFQVDPDHIVARSPKQWVRGTLATISLGGGLFMISDKKEDYNESLAYDIQRSLPPLKAYPAESAPIDYSAPNYANYVWDMSDQKPIDEKTLGYFQNQGEGCPFGSLWAHHLSGPAGNFTILQRNAMWNLPETEVSLQNLGLDPKKEYLLFDFWQGKFLGSVKKSVKFPAQELTLARTLCLRANTGLPKLVGSSRHVSCGFLELQKEKYSESKKVLGLNLKAQPEDYFIYVYVPKGLAVPVPMGDGAGCKVLETDGQCVKISVPKSQQDLTLNLKF